MAANSPKNPLDHSLVHLLHRACQCAGQQSALELGATGLAPGQHAILLALDEHDSMHQTQIVERTGIDRSTVTGTIRRLLLKGFIERKRNANDTRFNDVRLTNNGRKILKASARLAASVDERILSFVEPPKREQFLQNLRAIVEGSSASPKEKF
jgi:MarR family transcriptional regulator, temperature-dependent positive regulator of motility